MGILFATLLIVHVVLGLVGVMVSFRVTYLLLRPENQTPSLKCASALAFLSYIISWLSGGWYYWKYYGTNVKPKIIGGDYAWAHTIFMEAKEHVFLFLPFATFLVALIIWRKADTLSSDPVLKKALMVLSLVVTIIATIVTLSGVLITGGAR